MLVTPYQTKLTFLANLLTILRILLQWKLDYDRCEERASMPASSFVVDERFDSSDSEHRSQKELRYTDSQMTLIVRCH